MEPRIIKTDDEYRTYLAEVERLVMADPNTDTADGRRLELLAMLVEDYERQKFAINTPDPIDAIVFRMEQQGLRQKDIAPLLGGKNRASEVLSRKRPLTLPMIRALHESLDIPSELLIREPVAEYETSEEVHEDQVPLNLLIKRGWLDAKLTVRDLIRGFEASTAAPVRLRHTATYGANSRTNRTHVWLWLSRVRQIGDAQSLVHSRFRREELNAELIRYVTRLSFMEKGPRLAKEFLQENGIVMVVEPHLPRTHLDGAALLASSGTPIVAVSLREDRTDNFWFTLTHELVHAWKHLDSDAHRTIVDENIDKHGDEDEIEKEANDIAADILIPLGVWRRSEAFRDPSPAAIRSLAKELHISPAIVAGRIRFERKNYAQFSKLVGYRKVRSQFPEIRWE
jgi:HTH-type transcriptional regulator/antitoxin HigA